MWQVDGAPLQLTSSHLALKPAPAKKKTQVLPLGFYFTRGRQGPIHNDRNVVFPEQNETVLSPREEECSVCISLDSAGKQLLVLLVRKRMQKWSLPSRRWDPLESSSLPLFPTVGHTRGNENCGHQTGGSRLRRAHQNLLLLWERVEFPEGEAEGIRLSDGRTRL